MAWHYCPSKQACQVREHRLAWSSVSCASGISRYPVTKARNINGRMFDSTAGSSGTCSSGAHSCLLHYGPCFRFVCAPRSHAPNISNPLTSAYMNNYT